VINFAFTALSCNRRSMRSLSGPESLPKYLVLVFEEQEQFLPVPVACPQGQGLAARTN
jgi:hypothetical protein